MDLTHISFLDLPFTDFFQDYITDHQKLSAYFEADPFSDKDIEKVFQSFKFQNDRHKTVELLKEYNSGFGAGGQTIRFIEKLGKEDAVAVVTGQQLTLYGGPLFTVYKVLTAIHLARSWEEKFDRPCVPVFWMADEDHDYDEIAQIGLPMRDDHQKVVLQSSSQTECRVSKIELDDNFSSFRKKVIENQFDTDFTDQLWRQLDQFYKEGNTVGKAFGELLLSLFEDYGLILAGSAHPSIKSHLSSAMVESVRNTEEQFQSLKSQTESLIADGYHGQVHLQHSNLFWIDDDGNRVKLSYENNTWSEDNSGYKWSSDELVKVIEDQPERFSPNVFLRPVMQNKLLPAFAYVSGPSETAYHAQMKRFFADFGLKMPVLIPRFSITLMESGIDRIFGKLPFDFSEYDNRIEDLESQFVEQTDTIDIEAIFKDWKEKVEEISQPKTEEIKEIDPTLEGSSEKAESIFFSELDKLKGKVYRSVKDQEKTQLKRIQKIKNNLFPNGNFQEREVAFIYFMNKYGLDIWDRLLETLEDETPDNHKLIRL